MSFMEDQNLTVTQSPTTNQTVPPTTPVLEQAVAYPNSNNNTPTVPETMGVVGVDSALDSVSGSKPEAVGSEPGEKKRRGRPRKYDVNGNLLSPTSAPPGFSFGSSSKRSRGRPRGTGKLQLLASIGGFVAETAGGSLTPHLMIVNAGEDVVNRISSFSQKVRRAVCILSATGSISSVNLRQAGSSVNVLRYEGRFEILGLSGSCTSGGVGGVHRKNDMVSVSLAKPDGNIFGGAVEGSMIAATPIQLVVGSFKQNISKEIKRRCSSGSSTAPNKPADPDSAGVPLKAPEMTEGKQSCPSPTTGLVPTTEGLPDNVIPAATIGLPDNVIPATTNGVPNIVIPADHNMHYASANGVGLDCPVLQPITDQKMSADVDASGPQI